MPEMPVISNDNADILHDREADFPGNALPSSPARSVEIFAGPQDAGAAGFALAQTPREGRVLWIQERMVSLEKGRPFGQGCERFGCGVDRLVLACSRNTRDLLWAMEEGLRCNSLAAIIGEAWGNPAVLDFTASKRLAMRAERQGVPVFLLRYNAQADLSAARQRWRVLSAPSAPHPHDANAPGLPRWHAELFRARDAKPGKWLVQYDRAAHRLHQVPAFRDPALAGEARHRAGNTITGSFIRTAASRS
ncbi:Error-prone repair protein ImuA [Aurantiacibacter gangjinensis]|nr:Error-prone repair protein ImuA [Aurantiacibacter gangjinensis]